MFGIPKQNETKDYHKLCCRFDEYHAVLFCIHVCGNVCIWVISVGRKDYVYTTINSDGNLAVNTYSCILFGEYKLSDYILTSG